MHGAAAIVLLGVCVAAGAEPPRAEVVWLPAQVADASDRAYEPIAIQLIDQATSSIVLSLYVVQAPDDARHPVTRLLRDLMDAAQRGVAVTVYLNTKLRGVEPDAVAQAAWVARLTTAGVRVVPIRSTRMVHDKLLIVDERYVLEGSTNWTVTALKTNWESNTLVDAPALARAKLFRLHARAHHLQAPGSGPPSAPPLPDTLPLPTALLAREGGLTRPWPVPMSARLTPSSSCSSRGCRRGAGGSSSISKRSAWPSGCRPPGTTRPSAGR